MQKALGEMGILPKQPLPRIHVEAELDRIEQKIKFEVDSEGAKAAVATYALVAQKCCRQEKPPSRFVIDHSFHYFIFDGNIPIVQGCVKDAGVLVK